jgi:hypothetical protein
MTLTFRIANAAAAAGILGGVLAGCGSSSPMENYPDAQSFDTRPDGVVGPQPDGGADGPTKPDPVSSQTNVRVVAGPVQFLTSGATCSGAGNETGGGDRWCAFLTPSSSSLDNRDLFVVNVSQAAAGTAIACGGIAPDPNCLRLTRGFFEEGTAPAPHAAFFQGDTLVFFDVFGTPFGWRPGMLNARVLTDSSGGDVHDCFPAKKGNAILCFRDLPTSTVDTTFSDVLLGRLDAPADRPLSRVETIITATAVDPVRRFQFGFVTPSGDTARKIDDAASLRTVASDISRWSASADGTRWYWLSGYGAAMVTGTLMGDLQTASLDGTGVSTMIVGVHDYSASSSGPVVALTGLFELKSVKNPATAPTSVIDLDSGVRGLMAVGPEHVVYLKKFDSIFPLSDAYVRRIDGTQQTACTLTGQLDGVRYGLHFLPDSSALLWARVVTLDIPVGDLPPIDAILTNLGTCSRTIVASKVGDGDWGVADGTGVVVIDQSDNSDGSLRFRRLTSPGTLDPLPATLIHTRVDSFIPVFPMPGVVVFTVNAGSSKDGLYLNVARGGQGGADGGAGADAAPSGSAGTDAGG